MKSNPLWEIVVENCGGKATFTIKLPQFLSSTISVLTVTVANLPAVITTQSEDNSDDCNIQSNEQKTLIWNDDLNDVIMGMPGCNHRE